MKSAGWLIFREMYLKIILSILTVIAVMLLLQNALNQLKLRSLAAEATSSRLQISASTIESAIVRAEGLGLEMDEMEGLQGLLDRERGRDDSIAQLAIVSPIGRTLVVSGVADMPQAEMDQALRRVMGSREKVSLFDAGERLYTGRVLHNSSDAVMGAILLTTPTEKYLAHAEQSFDRMNLYYLVIFGCVAALLIPFIIFQFSSISHAFRAFDPARVTGTKATEVQSGAAVEVQRAIDAGNAKYAAAANELDGLLDNCEETERDTREAPA